MNAVVQLPEETLRLEVPIKMLPFAFQRWRHKIARGGRGSTKSWSIARILAVKGYKRPIRWLCCRESQASIKQSSHRLLCDQIERLGLSPYYRITQDGIYGTNGTEFTFIGLKEHTSDNVKSYEGYDGAWIAEAQAISETSAEKLVPTLRKGGSELWWDYNPDNEQDWIHKQAEQAIADRAKGMPTDTLVITINWPDNPWFPEELAAERRKMLRINKDLHDHVYGGQCRSRAGIIFKRHWFQFFDLGKEPKALNLYIASDYAAPPDPDNPAADPDWTEHGVFGVDPDDNVYVLAWWSGQEDPAVWIDAWIDLCSRHEPMAAFREKGAILRSVDGQMRRRMEQRGVYTRCIDLASISGKAERALGFAARASLKKVFLPNGQPWSARLLNQLCAFTGQDGRTDDMVDACSLFGRGVEHTDVAALEDVPRGAKPHDDYDVDDEGDDSWKTA